VFFPFWLPIWIYLWIHPSFKFHQALISDGTGHAIPVRQLFKNNQKVNRWLRTVPFYLEILKGRMSLVGSEIMNHSESEFIAGFKPGITGLVQINASESLHDDEKKKYNIYYLKNYSPLLDLKILLGNLIPYKR
jgi:hypothetical protein